VSDPHRLYEIRCPVHGFITINDWEREIINQPAFQRLRRIRQLALTDLVYPGAMHTRFEHSLGVLHVANRLYDSIVNGSRELLRSERAYTDEGLSRDRILVRLTALLHDVGHAPFSHGPEELFPFIDETVTDEEKKRFKHENYSAAIIRTQLRDVIENHPLNQNFDLKAGTIADLLEGNVKAGRALLWREIVSGQLDADRIDYLIRDSLHTGVDYGKFDWRRLVNSVQLLPGNQDGNLRLGVSEGGFHAAEGLVIARYFMFTQVYFHKTRVAYDTHLKYALAEMLPGGTFPKPEGEELNRYLSWDDWRVLGALADGKGGEHGDRLANREHYREVYHTPDSPKPKDIQGLTRVRKALGDLLRHEALSETSSYKLGKPDIPVVSDNPDRAVKPLSAISSVVRGLLPVGKVMLYCRKEDVDRARDLASSVEKRRSTR